MSAHLRSLLLIVLLSTFLCAAEQVQAHQRSESYSHWEFDDRELSVRFTVTSAETRRLLPGRRNEPLHDAVTDYLIARLRPAGDAACRQLQSLHVVPSARGYLQLEAAWHCPAAPASLQIDAFFDIAAEHSHFASVVHGEHLVQALLRSDQSSLSVAWLTNDAPVPVDSSFGLFMQKGVSHIATGVDHVVFLLALLLVCRRAKEAVWAITGFTLGHSASLSVAVLGYAQPIVPAIEAAIGLTIVLVAVERVSNMLPSAVRVALAVFMTLLVALGISLFAGAEWQVFMLSGMALFGFCYLLLAHDFNHIALFRILLTTLFGLVHGLGFAGAFLATELPGERLLLPLAGFNLGVEIGQLLVVGLLALLASATHPFPRARSLMGDALTAVVCGMGTFWFVSRLFAP